MEANAVLEKIRKRGLTIKAVGDSISLAPKDLINHQMIGFVREYKQELLAVLNDERTPSHIERKRMLREGRLEVLRILLWRFLEDESCRNFKRHTNKEVYDEF